MSDLKALYQEIILDHNRNPRNFKIMEDATLFGGRIQSALRRSLHNLSEDG